MQIRRLGPADGAAYRELRLRGLRDHPDAFTSSFEEDVAKPIDALARRLGDAAPASSDWVLGAFVDGELVGVAGLSREQQTKARHKATVFGMYVAAEHVGQGIGRALLDELIDEAKRTAGLEQLKLTVTRGNEPARQLYLSAGFESFGVERGAIKVGDTYFDKEHMMLLLTAR